MRDPVGAHLKPTHWEKDTSTMNQSNLTMADIVKSQRTEKGEAFTRRRKAFAERLRAKEPKAVALAKTVTEEFLQAKAISPGTVHNSTFLTNFSVQYQNDVFIGERLMPVVPVDHRSDEYVVYNKRDRLGQYDDSIGPRGDAKEVEESRTTDNYSVKDRALQNFLPQEALDNQDAIFDEMLDLTESVADNLALNREVRIATKLTTAANYGGNATTLSGSSQWDSGAGGDPIANVLSATAGLWQGKAGSKLVGFTSLDVLNVLVRHVNLLELFKYTRDGLLTRQQLAGLFGLDDLLIGAARYDIANSGQTANYQRIWGKHFGIIRVAERPTKRSAQFGSTFQLRSDPVTLQWFDPKKGKSGGHFVKIGLSDDHKIVAADTGFLYRNVIS